MHSKLKHEDAEFCHKERFILKAATVGDPVSNPPPLGKGLECLWDKE